MTRPSDEPVMFKMPTCPECKSFNVYSTFGDVKGRGVDDAFAALAEVKPYHQSFTTRAYHLDGCNKCGHKWNYRETDGVVLTLDARKRTRKRTILEWIMDLFGRGEE